MRLIIPYLFRLALIPQNKLRNETHYGYKAWEKAINHLIYMDDLKLSRKISDEQLQGLLHTVKQFSGAIRMENGLDKCATATFADENLLRTLYWIKII